MQIHRARHCLHSDEERGKLNETGHFETVSIADASHRKRLPHTCQATQSPRLGNSSKWSFDDLDMHWCCADLCLAERPRHAWRLRTRESGSSGILVTLTSDAQIVIHSCLPLLSLSICQLPCADASFANQKTLLTI